MPPPGEPRQVPVLTAVNMNCHVIRSRVMGATADRSLDSVGRVRKKGCQIHEGAGTSSSA